MTHALILSPTQVLENGLKFISINPTKGSDESRVLQFHKHYGSSPTLLAAIWNDLLTTNIEGAVLTQTERSYAGFRMYCVAHYYLWTYEKNSHLLASRFKIRERDCRGAPLWKWIMKFAALKEKKIVWDARLDHPDSEKFAVSVDGVDFWTTEKAHPTFNMDKGNCSHKFNKCAAKYEIVLSVFESKCVSINGPFRGGESDLNIFIDKTKEKLVQSGKIAIVDKGYRSKIAEENALMSFPDKMDRQELSNFKSRARLRHESFNGRLKAFGCLSKRFSHGFEKHKHALEAVVVIVQYQMELGSPLFAV